MSTPQEIALERCVRDAKGLSALPGIHWDDIVWVLQDNDSTVSERSHKSQSKSLWFTKLMAKGKLSNANSEARGVALWLDQNPGKVPALPGYDHHDVLTGSVMARILEFASSTGVKKLVTN
jgi:hypothetical protein